jgi:hypothetical protein
MIIYLHVSNPFYFCLPHTAFVDRVEELIKKRKLERQQEDNQLPPPSTSNGH